MPGIAHKLTIMRNAWHGRQARALLYHCIVEDPSDSLAVSPSVFAQQMEWLACHRFKVISTAQLRTAIMQELDLPRTVVLTFDDATSDFFEAALPVLRRYGFCATVFVPTGKVGQVSDWSKIRPPRPLMSQEQLAQLVELGFELGSHTVTHASLPTLDNKALMYELTGSFASLRRLTGSDNIPFAYPYGRASKREQAAVKAAGYTCAYLAGGLWGNGKGSDLFCLTRDVMRSDITLVQFASLVNGHADLQRALGALARRLRGNKGSAE